MIYLATYNNMRRRVLDPEHKRKRIIFIETEDRLAIEKVVMLINNLTKGDLEESSVQIIGQRAYDSKTINNPLLTFYRLE